MGKHSAEASLLRDALNRMWRTFVQALIYAVLAGAATGLWSYFQNRDALDVSWEGIVRAVVQGAGMAALSFWMRFWADRSSIPTPLPPEGPVEPVEPVEPAPSEEVQSNG